MGAVEWQSDPGTTAEQPSLQDSLVEDELETNQPLVVNTVPVLDIQPNRENLEREEIVMVQKILSDRCGCHLWTLPSQRVVPVRPNWRVLP